MKARRESKQQPLATPPTADGAVIAAEVPPSEAVLLPASTTVADSPAVEPRAKETKEESEEETEEERAHIRRRLTSLGITRLFSPPSPETERKPGVPWGRDNLKRTGSKHADQTGADKWKMNANSWQISAHESMKRRQSVNQELKPRGDVAVRAAKRLDSWSRDVPQHKVCVSVGAIAMPRCSDCQHSSPHAYGMIIFRSFGARSLSRPRLPVAKLVPHSVAGSETAGWSGLLCCFGMHDLASLLDLSIVATPFVSDFLYAPASAPILPTYTYARCECTKFSARCLPKCVRRTLKKCCCHGTIWRRASRSPRSAPCSRTSGRLTHAPARGS
mmetsp:Transcript_32914/g.99586  ORF Transcript_32914/g.99586 Transcript_32914/m.99586 type:complete len:331 (+) Transcript_32914:984-1976(+)